jgi:hypothetical protein
MGGAGLVIIFVMASVAGGVVSLFYLVFASHYFLVTLIDSSSGQDEIHYPDENVVDWWWKPILCLWILLLWGTMGSILLAPLVVFGPTVFAISLGVLLWFVYPLGILSVLYTGNWMFFLHPIILWRMLKHYGAFAYVHFITSITVAVSGALVFGAFTQSFWWILPAALVVPTTLLFYARHWGRFAWLSLNFAPRKKKPPRTPIEVPQKTRERLAAPIDETETDETSDGVREGLPPAFPHGIQEKTPDLPLAAEEEDEWAAHKNPYGIATDATHPSLQESADEPMSAPAKPPMPVVEEEEDEWATNKKPYGVIDEPTPSEAPSVNSTTSPDADKPIVLGQYYDNRDRKEKTQKAKARQDAAQNYMPTPSKKTPTFQTALFFGVWAFMIEPRTLRVWGNLVVFTVVELFFLTLMMQTFPRLD